MLYRTASLLLATYMASAVDAHGALLSPVSRNYFDPSRRGTSYGGGMGGPEDFQSGNGQNQNPPFAGFNVAGGSPCGDAGGGKYSAKGWHYAGRNATDPLGKGVAGLSSDYVALRDDKSQWGKFEHNKTFDVEMTITAYHGGNFGLYMCPWEDDKADFDYVQCQIFAPRSASSKYNTRSPYFVKEVELPANYVLCANCEDDKVHPRVEYAGRKWATTGYDEKTGKYEKLCGFSDKIPDWPGYGRDTGCGYNPVNSPYGKNPPYKDRTSLFVVKGLQVPSALKTKNAVLVWHWITENQGEGVTQAEQFMNCADMTSTNGPPTPEPEPSPEPSPSPSPAPSPAPSPSTGGTCCYSKITAQACSEYPAGGEGSGKCSNNFDHPCQSDTDC